MGLILARIRLVRSMTAPNCAEAVGDTLIPNAEASRTAAMARAARIRLLEGTQPTLRQSPPKKCCSINATLAPRPAAPEAETNPAEPAPITTKLYRPAGRGFCQFAGRTCARSARLY